MYTLLNIQKILFYRSFNFQTVIKRTAYSVRGRRVH